MSEGINTGGPAFPVVAENGLGHVADGMTLRDYFAEGAMRVLLSINYSDCVDDRFVVMGATAREAYEAADAMIEARSK